MAALSLLSSTGHVAPVRLDTQLIHFQQSSDSKDPISSSRYGRAQSHVSEDARNVISAAALETIGDFASCIQALAEAEPGLIWTD